MFDLFRSRDKAVRILLGGLLFLVALSMLVYLIPGANLSTGSRTDQIVAEVGDQTVTVRDVQNQLQSLVKGRQLPEAFVASYVPQMVEELVAHHALAYEAKRLGFVVSDADVANTIRSLSPNIASMTPEQYREFIEQQMQQTVPEFEANLRANAYELMLTNLAASTVVIPPSEVQKEFARRNEKIKVEFITFDARKIKDEVKPTQEELVAHFNANRASFKMPETRTFSMIVSDPAKVGETIEIPDSTLLQYYNANKDNFRVPERVKARHILLMTSGKSKEEVAKIHAKAEDLLKQLKAGADFGELAKKYSEDPGSAKNGGDVGWVVRGQMVKNFEAACFSLQPKQLSDIVTTEYGFHIVQVLEKESAHLQPFDAVKEQIAAGIRKQTVNDRTQALIDQARAELVKAPKNAQQIADKLHLSYVKVDHAKPGDPLPLVGGDRSVSDAVNTLQKGEVSQTVQAGERLVVVALDDITPTRPAEFNEVVPQVREHLQEMKSVQIVAERSKKAADLAKSNGGDMQAAAKAVGGEVKTTDLFTRDSTPPGLGSGRYFEPYFASATGTIIGPLNVGPQTVVAKLLEKAQPDPAQLAAQRQTIVDGLKSKIAQQRLTLLQDSIVARLTQQGKLKIHHDVLNRFIASRS